MKTLLLIVGFFVLLMLCWPLALMAVLLVPLVWLVLLPFRLVGLVIGALFAFIRALLFLPARVLGYSGR